MNMEDAPSKGELAFEQAVDTAHQTRWWEKHDNLAITAAYMAEHEGEFTIKDLALMVEKPWKFPEVYVKAVEWTGEDGIDAYIDTLPPAEWVPTHRSRRDGSEARLIATSESGTNLLLANENGDEWQDALVEWAPIDEEIGFDLDHGFGGDR